MGSYGEIHLHRLTDYEIRCSERYRRFFSLVFMTSGNGALEFKKILGDLLRTSDEFIELEGFASILMSETDKEAALEAVNRFEEMQHGSVDVRYSVASFPEDGKSSLELLLRASDRLDKARDRDEGAIVSDE